MKTIHKLFLIATIALGLGVVACNDSDPVSAVDESKANTHVSVTLKLGGKASTRSLPEDYNYIGEWAGQDEITDVTVYISDNVSVNGTNFSVGAVGGGKDYEVSGGVLKPTTAAAIKTTVGLKKVYVLINGTADAKALLNETNASAFETNYASIMELANSGAFGTVSTSASKLATVTGSTEKIMMTNIEPQTINVAPNVTQDETITDSKNRVSLDVDRAVARVMVTTKSETYDVPSVDGGSIIGTVSDVTWVLAQGENSLYVQRKSNWETPNHTWKPSGNADYWASAGDKYDYSGLYENYDASTKFGGTVVPTMAAYSASPNIGDLADELESLRGKFILPTTHEYATGDASNYKKGNTAYVLVRAKFTPSAFADGTTYSAGDDFYLGANGKFFGTAKNAVDPEKGGVVGQTAAKYVGGKVLYYAWVNPDEVPQWYNSPVIRNNIYHIHITGFKNLGTNWNPLFPEDPDNPTLVEDPDNPSGPKIPSNPDPKPTKPTDPTDPSEPENPIDPEDPLTTPETWMSVDVKVLPWKVHSYGVDLGI